MNNNGNNNSLGGNIFEFNSSNGRFNDIALSNRQEFEILTLGICIGKAR